MANIISSAIVNKPPPQAVANLLARRNKIHHLNKETDETLLSFFDRDPGNDKKSSKSNTVTMPSRNWAALTENSRSATSSLPPPTTDNATAAADSGAYDFSSAEIPKDGHFPLHKGEVGAGSEHKSANVNEHGKGSDGSLDVVIRVECDQHDAEGKTRGYGMTVPVLRYAGAPLVVDEGRESWAGSRRSKQGEKSRGGSAGTGN